MIMGLLQKRKEKYILQYIVEIFRSMFVFLIQWSDATFIENSDFRWIVFGFSHKRFVRK